MTDVTDPDAQRLPAVNRRTVLLGVGAAGVAGLAGCGGDDAATVNPTEPADGGATTSRTTPKEPTAGATPSDPGTEGGAQPADGLVATAEVPVGGGIVLESEEIVVTQPANGEFRAYTAICTHQGCVVATVTDGEIRCPCHGSRFSADDGSVVNGPAQAPLSEVAIAVQGEQITRA